MPDPLTAAVLAWPPPPGVAVFVLDRSAVSEYDPMHQARFHVALSRDGAWFCTHYVYAYDDPDFVAPRLDAATARGIICL